MRNCIDIETFDLHRQLHSTINLNINVDSTDEAISLSTKYLQKVPNVALSYFGVIL